MKNIQVFLLMLCLALGVSAQTNYQSLDPEHPIEYKGDRIVYQGQEIVLGPKAFFIDGQLSDEAVKGILMCSTASMKRLCILRLVRKQIP